MKREKPINSIEIFSKCKLENLEPKEKKKMYSLRLKIKTVEAIKRMSANIGVPYQTYVNAILDNVAKTG